MSDRHPMTGNRMSPDEAAGVHGFERHTHDVVVRGSKSQALRVFALTGIDKLPLIADAGAVAATSTSSATESSRN